MYVFSFVVYAAIFDLLYGVVTLLLLILPILGMAVASTFMEDHSSLDSAARGMVMLFVLPWKAATLWSASQATKRQFRGGESFIGAIRGTLGEVRLYLPLLPLVGKIFKNRGSSASA